MKLGKKAQDFLLCSYFGFDTEKCDIDSIKLKCAHKAYLDFNRTLRFNGGSDKRRQFTTLVEQKIIDKIKAYNRQGDDFDTWHEIVCNEIINIANEEKKPLLKKPFSYGQAQKWLNMTLKYLWLLDILDNIDEEKLHVPVDNFILQAIKESVGIDEEKNTLKSRITTVTTNEQYKFGKEPWSNLGYYEYRDIQNQIKESINMTRIEWENMAWIEIAKKRSAK